MAAVEFDRDDLTADRDDRTPHVVNVLPVIPQERPLLAHMYSDQETEVILEWRDRSWVGHSPAGDSDAAAAAATLDALESILPGSEPRLDWIDTTTPGAAAPHPFITVVVSVSNQSFVGSSFVRGDPRVAAARAVLASLNRYFARMTAAAV